MTLSLLEMGDYGFFEVIGKNRSFKWSRGLSASGNRTKDCINLFLLLSKVQNFETSASEEFSGARGRLPVCGSNAVS